mmetsp:Transcript_26980/g.77824  ORF Transcript_26980/g.77824 Transcript_26980/m.77824 type:complete len:116 (-) Transcript_26980:189-536(-)
MYVIGSPEWRCSWAILFNNENTLFSAATSNALVLSSIITNRGLLTKMRANASRCCSPRDKMFDQSATTSRPLIGSPLPILTAVSLSSTDSNIAKSLEPDMLCRRTWAWLSRCPSG